MGRLFEDFEIVCSGDDHMLEKSGDVIQGRAIYKGGHYSRKYGIRFFKKGDTIQGGKLIKEIR